MIVRTTFIATLCVSLLTSVCTGGPASALFGYLDQHVYAQGEDSGLQSFGSIGYLSCADNSRRGNQDMQASADSCSKNDSCLRSLSMLREKTTEISISSAVSIAIPSSNALQFIAIDVSRFVVPIARAGPLYPQAPQIARSLQKIE